MLQTRQRTTLDSCGPGGAVRESYMSRHYETAADQVWKDKIQTGISTAEILLVTVLMAEVLVCGVLFCWL